jgi:hypothetical protein
LFIWDVEEILKIKPGTRMGQMGEDTIAWNYERTSLYSVRSASAYRPLKAEQKQEEASAGNESGLSTADAIWKKL